MNLPDRNLIALEADTSCDGGCAIQRYTVSVEIGDPDQNRYKDITSKCQEVIRDRDAVTRQELVYLRSPYCTVSVATLESSEYNMVDRQSVWTKFTAYNCLYQSVSVEGNDARIPDEPSRPITFGCPSFSRNSVTVEWEDGVQDLIYPINRYELRIVE